MILIDINGFEGRYAVSRCGKVMNVKTKRILKPSLRHGYPSVDIGGKSRVIHRLVAEAWIENPDNLPQVNHIDGNKENNDVDNLQWCDASWNKKHSWDIGTSVVTAAKREASRRNMEQYHLTRRNQNV